MSEVNNQGGRLKNKVAIITGGAYGIGRSFCLGMAGEGAKIVVADIDLEAAKTTVAEIEVKGTDAIALKTDVSSPEDTHEMAKKAAAHFGTIDILVNNAAIFARVKVSAVPFYDIDLNEWDRVMEVNLKGPFLCSRAVFSYMKAQGRGKIINISSSTFFTGTPRFAHYVASKGGVIGLSRSLASAMGEYNINVNCIAPGRTFSEDPTDQDALQRLQHSASTRIMKRIEYPEDLVGTAIFLASADSDFITGQTIIVDGGITMH
ncbi:SDR family NAD(P)-dependent oxidoreductase [Chloroflexota bacterium]